MQIDDELGVKLHQRASLDQPLTTEEQVQLQAWYDKNDREEAAILRANWHPLFNPAEVETAIKTTLEQIAAVTARIQAVEQENEQLHQRLAELRRQQAMRATQAA